jgi:ketosteroid isomerase-like protein
MTLENNKVLVRQWIAAWMARDLTALDALFAPDYTVNEKVVGVEGVRQGVNFLHSILADISAEANDLVAEGDKVLVHAGLLPDWSAQKAVALSAEVEAMLASGQADAFLRAE